MMNQDIKKVHVGSSDSKASILAALARIEDVPVGKTLIEDISDEEWNDESVADWKIEAGSENVCSADEADDCDSEFPAVA